MRANESRSHIGGESAPSLPQWQQQSAQFARVTAVLLLDRSVAPQQLGDLWLQLGAAGAQSQAARLAALEISVLVLDDAREPLDLLQSPLALDVTAGGGCSLSLLSASALSRRGCCLTAIPGSFISWCKRCTFRLVEAPVKSRQERWMWRVRAWRGG